MVDLVLSRIVVVQTVLILLLVLADIGTLPAVVAQGMVVSVAVVE